MAEDKRGQMKIKGGSSEQQDEKNEKSEKSKKKKNKLGVLILLIVTVVMSLIFSIKAKGGIKEIFSRKNKSEQVKVEKVDKVKESSSSDSWWPFGKKVYEFEK